MTERIERVDSVLSDSAELLELAEAEDDEGTLAEVVADVQTVEADVEKLEFQRMFSGKADASNAFVDIQAGSGGTEAQDWAEMLLRMYLRWAEARGFKAELVECSAGDVAGIKSATIYVEGDYAFGWLRTEIGVHRLVRKSPFDSGNRRHTSFTAVFVSPELDDNIDDRDRSELRRSGGHLPGLAGRAGSTSTKPTRPCASRTCRPASSCNVRTSAPSTRTRQRR